MFDLTKSKSNQKIDDTQKEFYIAFRKLEKAYQEAGKNFYTEVAKADNQDRTHSLRFKENKVRSVLLEATMLNLNEDFVNNAEF